MKTCLSWHSCYKCSQRKEEDKFEQRKKIIVISFTFIDCFKKSLRRLILIAIQSRVIDWDWYLILARSFRVKNVLLVWSIDVILMKNALLTRPDSSPVGIGELKVTDLPDLFSEHTYHHPRLPCRVRYQNNMWGCVGITLTLAPNSSAFAVFLIACSWSRLCSSTLTMSLAD